MSKNAARLLQDALQLSENERVELACGLLDSLDPEPPGEEARSNQEWLAEIERRARAALAGEPVSPGRRYARTSSATSDRHEAGSADWLDRVSGNR
jgi:putative addiction module component (TIGR02574 family)